MPRAIAATVALLATVVAAESDSSSKIILLSPEGSEARLHESVRTCNATGGDVFHSLYNFSGGEDFITYNFEVQQSGCYLIEERHPLEQDVLNCGFSRSTDVPVRIEFCKGGVKQMSVNQTMSGNTWRPLVQLPFFPGFPGKVAISRPVGPLGPWCQEGRCAWTASSFRLKWLAESCHEAEKMQEEPQAQDQDALREDDQEPRGEGTPRPAEQAPKEEKKDPPQRGAARSMGEQLYLEEPNVTSGRAMFTIQPPLDGCYLVEEMHPHTPDTTQVALTINYCKGQTASGVLSQADGRHDQWNYVASLPFYEGWEGSIELPSDVMGSSFRLTHVGRKCGRASTEVQRMEVRMTVDFATVADRIADFKLKLAGVLAPFAQVDASRLSVTHLREGSVIAEATVLPPAASFTDGGHAMTASEAVGAVTGELGTESSLLSVKLCEALDGSSAGCAASVLSVGLAPPMVGRGEQPASGEESPLNSKEQPARGEEDSSSSLFIPILLAALAATLMAAGFTLCWLLRCRHRGSPTTAAKSPKKQEEGAEEKGTAAAGKADSAANGPSDDASTLTPEMDDIERGEVMSEHTAEAIGPADGVAQQASNQEAS